MLTPGARRQRTAQLMRDLHTERNALSEMLDREATDHAEAIRERDEARAALVRAALAGREREEGAE